MTTMHESLINTIRVNVDNQKLSDTEFRQFIRNSLTVVPLERREPISDEEVDRDPCEYSERVLTGIKRKTNNMPDSDIAFALQGHIRTLRLSGRNDGLVEDIERACVALAKTTQSGT